MVNIQGGNIQRGGTPLQRGGTAPKCPPLATGLDRARTFEYVLHFVGCDTVTVSPNQIIIIIIKLYAATNIILSIAYVRFSCACIWSASII